MKYTNFPKNKQAQFLRLIKEKTDYSWKSLASFLKVNRSMIYFYLNEHSKLPLDHYEKLCKLAKVDVEKVETVEINNKEIEVKLPKLSDRFSEFLGALAGDGHVNNSTNEISISMDKDLDKRYSEHILTLFKDLFGIEARTYVQRPTNKLKCFAYSKKLVEFLYTTYHIPLGKKKGKLHIPVQLKSNEYLLKAYLRGCFDTDGSFHRHHKNDAGLGIISKDHIFIKELKAALEKLGYSPSLSGKNLYLYRKGEIDRFFKEIKPANHKHTSKYNYYQSNKRVPLTRELINR